MNFFEMTFVIALFSIGLAWAFVRYRRPKNQWKSKAHKRWYLLARD